MSTPGSPPGPPPGPADPLTDPLTDAPVDLRLVPLAAGAWAAAWWAVAARPGAVLMAALVGAVMLALLVTVLVRTWWRDRPGMLGLLAGTTAAVVAALSVTAGQLAVRERDPLAELAARGSVVTVTGRVSADPQRLAAQPGARPGLPARYLLKLSLSQVKSARNGVDAVAGSSAELVVLAGEAWKGVVVGAHVRGTGTLKATGPGEAALGVLMVRRPPVLLDPGAWPWRVAERLRAGLRAACVGLPDDAAGLLPGLVVGDTSHLDDRLRTDLMSSGLTHLTAVSGSNVSILAASVVAVLALGGAGQRLRFIGTLIAVLGFVVLARPEPSVLRAAVMGGLTVAGVLLSRRGVGIPVLSSCVIMLLLFDTWLARSYGFALSVLATGGLLLLTPVWLRRREQRFAAEGRESPTWRTAIVAAFAVPVAAQLVTAPVTVLLNPAISIVGIPANVLVAAAVAPATVCGVLAAVLGPVWPWAAHLVAYPGGLCTEWIAVVAHTAAHLPGGSFAWPQGPPGALLLGCTTVAGLVVVTGARRPIRIGVLLVAGVLLVVGCGRSGVPLPGGNRIGPELLESGPPADWVVVQCDVGQGSATLLRSGPDRAVMVDTGPDPALADRCLRRARVRVLDLVLLTHFHADHVGGLTGALHGRGRPPILVSPFAEPTEQVRDVRAAATAIGTPVVPVVAPARGTAGTAPWTVSWQAVAPDPVPVSPTSTEEPDGTEVNNSSVVLRAQVRGVTVVALGDVEPEAQRVLLRDPGAVTPADVVIVAHHGSARQEPMLYAALRPRVALIGVGLDNDYGHPAPAALDMLERLGTISARTDLQGQLAVTGDAAHLRLATTR